MKSRIACYGVLALCLLGTVSRAESIILYADHDASLDSGEPDTPGNGSTSTVWNNGSGRLFRTVEYWDLSGYAGATITSASYTVELKDFASELRPDMLNYPIPASEVGWNEADVTWNNFATAFDDSGGPFLTASVPGSAVPGDSLTIPVPASVIQDWIDDPCTNAGWMWKLSAIDEMGLRAGYEWWSTEADPCSQGAPAYLTIDGNFPEPYIPEFSVITNRDNYLKEKVPFGNYGVSTSTGAYVRDDAPRRFRGIMSFDLTPFAGYTVTGDAILRVKLSTARGGVIGFYHVQPGYADWSEGKSLGGGKTGPYNDWFEGTRWENFHDKFDPNSDPIATADWSGLNVGDTATVTIPAAVVQEWIDGVNAGMLLKMVDEETSHGYEFETRDTHLDPNNRPPELAFDAVPSPIGVVIETDRSTYLSEAEPNVPQGENVSTSFVQIDPNVTGEARYRSMLSFDLTPYAGRHIVGDGTMRLALVSHYGRNDPIEFYSVDPAIANWDPNAVKWEDNANDFVGPPIVTEDLSWVTRLRSGAVKIPASVIQDWIDGVNPGLFLKLQSEIADPDPDGNPIGYGYTNVDITDWVDEFEVVDLIPQVSLSFLAAPPGDADLDGKVNMDDVAIVASNWLQGDKTWTDGDFNQDDKVTLADVAVMAGNWLFGTL